MKKIRLKITGMHCTSCAFNIDGELEDTSGIETAETNYVKQETEVVFDHETVSPEKIIAIIKQLDESYHAEIIKA
jgi:Cu+-exporting ATPase